ncbi:P-loop containing nucleoside triphosphate hydrolase protein [Rickenella mellea]|uniref:DNA helicase n=1 Tax=Rickenella mellea TaxID=50990 RepID=A0A4Y7QC02_9AGAM|nr:P-loop containing nucleoside triphosphate hydrolase protein [Rickenella mellea]
MATSESHIISFIQRHRTLLEREREAEIEQTSLLLSNCSLKLLEQKGLALSALGVVGVNVGLGGKSLVALERPSAYHTSPQFPPHTFRPGDLARVEGHSKVAAVGKNTKRNSTKSAKSDGGVTGVVYKLSDTRIVIAIDQKDNDDDIAELPEHCRLVKLANSATHDRMVKTLDVMELMVEPGSTPPSARDIPQLTTLSRVLLGMMPPSPMQSLEIEFYDEHLNESQKEAVHFALESPEVACIHGPPGTGKTHTLIEIIRQIIVPRKTQSRDDQAPSRRRRVLVCGASNLSVDNILQRLLRIPAGAHEQLKCTRIGHPARVTGNDEVLGSTLDAQSSRSDQAELARDVKNELETTLRVLAGKEKGQKGKGPRGLERKKMWGEVKLLRKEYRQRENAVVNSVLAEAQIVLATCHSSGTRLLNNMKFDVVIIDEATQALEIACWIPVLKGAKLILAGDPMQLPPTILSTNSRRKTEKTSASRSTAESPRKAVKVTNIETPLEKKSKVGDGDGDTEVDLSDSSTSSSSEEDAESVEISRDSRTSETQRNVAKTALTLMPPRSLEVSMFDRLQKMYGSKVIRMLQVQYRMHKAICAFPTKTLYASKLKSDSSVAKHLLRDLPNTSSLGSAIEDDEVLGTPVVFFDTAGCEYYERADGGEGDEGSKSNENEAVVVAKWVERLVAAGVYPSQIAVITPYQAQVTLLSSQLRPVHGTELEIGTVDGMQGREKEAVIISLVRSNEKREVGFLKEKRRLNVAMTRARRHLCVVGDSATVQHGSKYLKKWIEWLEHNADVRFGAL